MFKIPDVIGFTKGPFHYRHIPNVALPVTFSWVLTTFTSGSSGRGTPPRRPRRCCASSGAGRDAAPRWPSWSSRTALSSRSRHWRRIPGRRKRLRNGSTDQDSIVLDQTRPEAGLTAAPGLVPRFFRAWFSLPEVQKTAKRPEIALRASASRKSQAFCDLFARPSHRGFYDFSKPALDGRFLRCCETSLHATFLIFTLSDLSRPEW